MIEQPEPRALRRVLLVGSGLGGVLLGVVLLATLFGGKADKVSVESPRPPAPAMVVEPTPEPPRAEPDVASVPVAARDPFRQVVTATENPSAAGGGQSAQPAAAATPPGPSPSPPPSDGASGAVPGKDEGSESAALELTSIARDDMGVERATITVDGEPYRPTQGEVFSYGFRMERFDGDCVEVSAGPERVRMCLPAATAQP